MKLNASTFLVATLVMVTASACTWVKPVEGTQGVALVKAGQVKDCKKLVSTTSKVKDRVGFINRGDKKVAQELITLAKNVAVKRNGDTLVAESDEVDGEQTFGVYKCRP